MVVFFQNPLKICEFVKIQYDLIHHQLTHPWPSKRLTKWKITFRKSTPPDMVEKLFSQDFTVQWAKIMLLKAMK